MASLITFLKSIEEDSEETFIATIETVLRENGVTSVKRLVGLKASGTAARVCL